MKWILIILFMFIPTIAYSMDYCLSVGAGAGQNEVSTKSIRFDVGENINNWHLSIGIEGSKHYNDGTVNIFSGELQVKRMFGKKYICIFAGLGHAFNNNAEDLADSTIGKWGTGIGIIYKYIDVQLRFTHSSNPFEQDEYGHNVISSIIGFRWE